ncbi:hypothetical protein BAUCODRAFT_326680 [Baudoinia panamericana UAMH 10762]|uniref:F-box domain-containing protein n=1 Tax=Baudoinia panamericana (strain UAMH 10762) TaxID=717646 RepID=M2MXK1_BAUPA|nr:uncharacterized protein BAUCODRAFT_326680 [Baudoinia panamericana UAMH 10762]EMC91394.1 hypothetical protein BAUCODRAFT_326680 [Baudoinia panamericana UAMH 10762]
MPHLPDEIWLQILNYLPPLDIWRSVHLTNTQLASAAEEAMLKRIIESFTIGLSFSLGAGSRHRWYDIRGTITFQFKEINKHNPQYVLFGSLRVHPDHAYSRAMERWKRMSADGLGGRQEWRVQYGDEGPLKMVRLPKLIVADKEGIFCDWKELFDVYFAEDGLVEPGAHVAWNSRAN